MNIENDLTISLVTYCNEKRLIERLTNCILNSKINFHFVLIDHSPTPIFSYLIDKIEKKSFSYIHNPNNPGFGSGHNAAFKIISSFSKYHLIVNPDIYFDDHLLINLLNFIKKNNNIGVLMPKILYPNGELQKIAKLLPTPITFLIRRFLPRFLFRKYNNRFELFNYDYSYVLDVPFLSGCFMLFNSSVFKSINGFDENFFMYIEDVDICRRVNNNFYRTVVFPFESVFHEHEYKSILNSKIMILFIKSYFYYFNKWGWFKDKERKLLNNKTLQFIEKKIS